MKKYQKVLFIINLAVVLVLFTGMIVQKEQLLNSGNLVLLELDERHYVGRTQTTLEYYFFDENRDGKIPKNGYVIAQKNANNVVQLLRVQEAETPLNKDEILLKYSRSYRNTLKIGVKNIRYEPSEQEIYEQVKYVALRAKEDGSVLLVGFCDKEYQMLINEHE